MNLLTGSTVNKLQQKQLHKQQEELDKRRRKGAKLHGEAGAAVCIQRWFRNNQKKKQQKQEDPTICGRFRRWWGQVNSDADTFYHRHVSHDAKPTLAELAKRRDKAEAGKHQEDTQGNLSKKAEDSKRKQNDREKKESESEKLEEPLVTDVAEKPSGTEVQKVNE